MDEVVFEREATGRDVYTLEDIFIGDVFNNEQQQELNQFRMLFAFNPVRLPSKCSNPICNSYEYIQRDVQTGKADEAAVSYYICASCGRIHR